MNLFWQMADGSSPMERLATSDFTQAPQSFSPDGQTLAFHEVDPTTGVDVWMLHLADRKVEPFLRTPANEADARISPDGHWIAYLSDESGREEIYLQPYPGPGGKWQVSTGGGTEPMWNPNGRELFYRNEGAMIAVDVATGPNLTIGRPRTLFQVNYVLSPVQIPNSDVSVDGQRFLMVKPSESTEAAPTQINLVLNWFEELKRLVPNGTK